MQRELMFSNISEAREQLEAIEKQILCLDYEEIKFRLDLEHAYHHLNFAWNIRHAPDEMLTKLSTEDFIKLSKYPKEDMDEYKY